MSKLPIYGASKLALYYATEVLRRELLKKSINVISVHPGMIRTEFHGRVGMGKVRGGVEAGKVAKAIEERKKEVYMPYYFKDIKVIRS